MPTLPNPNRVPGDPNHASDTNLIINAINQIQSQVNALPPGPQGPQGPAGANGTNGLAATVQVGNVYAGSPGAYPTVVNSGTAQNAIFDFTLPPREASAPVNLSDANPLPTAQSPLPGIIPSAARTDHVHAIPTDGVVTANITDLNVTTGKIADSAVTTAKLGAYAVTDAKILDSAVVTAKIADLNVTTGKLADEAVTTAKIANLTIVDGDISVTAAIAQGKVAGLVSDLGLKAPLDGPTFTGTVVLPSTTSIGNVSNTELSYLDGVTSAIQTQINSRVADTGDTMTGELTVTVANASSGVTINQSSTGAGLVVNQTGTGNAVTVNDQASDTTPFVIDASGNVGIGVDTPLRLVDANGIIRVRSVGATSDSAEGYEITNANAGADQRVLLLAGLDNGTAVIRNASTTSGGISFVIGSTERLAINSAGGSTFAGPVVTQTGSATSSPLRIPEGTVLTTPVAGTVENNANTLFYTPSAATAGRAYVSTSHLYSLAAVRNLANVATAQSLFGVGLTVAGATTYEMEIVFGVGTTGATSNSLGMSFLGTATLTGIGYMCDTTNQATSHATQGAVSRVYVQTAANTLIAAAVAAATFRNCTVKGLVRVNASGTFIPNITYSAAPGAAPVVTADSYIKMTPLGPNTALSIGAWA